MRIYEFCTQWLTLGMLFFVIDYHTQWLDVVTLGGLVAGSLIIACWTVMLDRLGRRLALLAVPMLSEGYPRPQNALPGVLHKALVLMGIFAGVYLLCQVLPGYTLTVSGSLVTFLIVYGLVAIALGNLLHINLDRL